MIVDEVSKLLHADFICEVHYLKWLINVVLVKKRNDKRRMCIDYINLNKICLKENFSLPLINQLVDATFGYELLTFVDIFSRYNQVKITLIDKVINPFIIKRGLAIF